MAAASTDKARKSYSFLQKSLSSGIGSADTTISLNNTTNVPTDTAVDFIIDRIDTNGDRTTGNIKELCSGVVSGSTIITASRGLHGTTAQVHSSGAVVEFVASGAAWNDHIDLILTEHKQLGGHAAITADSVTVATGKITTTTASKLEDAAIPLSTYRSENSFDYIASGLVWSGDAYASTRNASMTLGVVYINGQRGALSAVAARSFTASKDTYIDVLNTAGVFTLVYTEVANNAASPALAANSIRIGIIVTAAGSIAAAGSVNQGLETAQVPTVTGTEFMAVTDSLGNLICPRDPNRKTLGHRQIVADVTTASSTAVQLTGLKVPVIVPANRKIKITFYCVTLTNSAANVPQAKIFDTSVAGTQLQQANGNTTGTGGSISMEAVTTPTSTTKTYVVGFNNTASGTVTAAAGATFPAFIKVELA